MEVSTITQQKFCMNIMMYMCKLNIIIMPMYVAVPYRFILESPRWLLVQGREDEAKAVLAKIARGNGRKMTVSQLKRPTSQPSQTSVSVTELFRTPVIRQRTLILLVVWYIYICLVGLTTRNAYVIVQLTLEDDHLSIGSPTVWSTMVYQ